MTLLFAICAVVLVWALAAVRLSVQRCEALIDNPEGVPNSDTMPMLLTVLPVIGPAMKRLVTRVHGLARAEQLSKSRYSVLTSNTAAAIILQEPDGVIDWASPYTEVLTGYSISEVIAQGASFFAANVHEDDRDLLERARVIAASGEPFQCTYRFYHRSGMLLWLETRTMPIPDPGSDVYVSLSITVDVTASVNNKLQIEERSRDLHEFTYMISHDLKAPILTIKGMLAMLEDDLADGPPSTKEPLGYIARSVTRLEELVGIDDPVMLQAIAYEAL